MEVAVFYVEVSEGKMVMVSVLCAEEQYVVTLYWVRLWYGKVLYGMVTWC